MELVLTVAREVVLKRRAATRSERQPGQLISLREIGRQHERVLPGRPYRTSHSQPADFLRCREISVEQRRRQTADIDVVKPVARVVGRQQCRGVDIHGKQIADRVLIFSAIEAVERLGPAGIRFLRRDTIQRRFQICDERVVGRFIRPRTSGSRRRHRTGSQLPHRVLPHGDVLAHVVHVFGVERETTRLQFCVVAARAIPVEDRARRSRRGS